MWEHEHQQQTKVSSMSTRLKSSWRPDEKRAAAQCMYSYPQYSPHQARVRARLAGHNSQMKSPAKISSLKRNRVVCTDTLQQVVLVHRIDAPPSMVA